jgi:hypothetical protein
MTFQNADQKAANRRVAIIGLIGLVTAGILVIVGRTIVSTSSYSTVGLFGQTGVGVLSLKSLLATIALGLAVVQVGLALWLYQKLPFAGRAPKRIGITHRTVGVVAVLVTLPVAFHCAIAYGVQVTSLRVGIHSFAGCFFYGAFLAKVLLVQTKRLPGWALPVAGGILAVLIAVIWYTSALYYYNGFSLPG